jgi:abortive infection bacteriophage resistance protein
VFRLLYKRFKLKIEDELRVNLKHLAHYILAWIIYIDDICKIYKALKVKNKKYLVRIY